MPIKKKCQCRNCIFNVTLFQGTDTKKQIYYKALSLLDKTDVQYDLMGFIGIIKIQMVGKIADDLKKLNPSQPVKDCAVQAEVAKIGLSNTPSENAIKFLRNCYDKLCTIPPKHAASVGLEQACFP